MTGILLLQFALEVVMVIAIVIGVKHYRKLLNNHKSSLKEKEIIFGFVHDIGEAFADSDNPDLDNLVRKVLLYAMRTVKAGAGVVYLKDNDRNLLRARVVSGIFPPLASSGDVGIERVVSKSQHIEKLVKTQIFTPGEGLVGEVADWGEPLCINSAEHDARIPDYDLDFLKIRSLVLIPMRFHRRVLGVMGLVNRVDGEVFTEADVNLLQALADQASVSIHYAGLKETLEDKQRIDHDLNIARNIQAAMLPKDIPHVPGIDIAAFNHPALEIGGDYYDFIVIDEQHLGVAIADVSGKSVSGAMVMAMCRAVLRAHAIGCLDPGEVLRNTNAVLHEDIAEDMFISLAYLIINAETREVQIARAGHEKPLVIHQASNNVETVSGRGMAIGIGDAESFNQLIDVQTMTLEKGDTVLLYTDGITEAMNNQGHEWGIHAFKEALRVSAKDAETLLSNVKQRLFRFTAETAQYDDMTLLVLKFSDKVSDK